MIGCILHLMATPTSSGRITGPLSRHSLTEGSPFVLADPSKTTLSLVEVLPGL